MATITFEVMNDLSFTTTTFVNTPSVLLVELFQELL